MEDQPINIPYGYTTQEVINALISIAPAMDKAWRQVVGNTDIWEQRIDGPVYRQTPVLGRFRWYRQLRVWWLRKQI